MRIVVVYKEFSDHGREVEEWVREFEQRSGRGLEKLNPETPEGEAFCRARDILEYPTIVVLDESDGRTYGQWGGTPLPQIDEVLSFVVSR